MKRSAGAAVDSSGFAVGRSRAAAGPRFWPGTARGRRRCPAGGPSRSGGVRGRRSGRGGSPWLRGSVDGFGAALPGDVRAWPAARRRAGFALPGRPSSADRFRRVGAIRLARAVPVMAGTSVMVTASVVVTTPMVGRPAAMVVAVVLVIAIGPAGETEEESASEVKGSGIGVVRFFVVKGRGAGAGGAEITIIAIGRRGLATREAEGRHAAQRECGTEERRFHKGEEPAAGGLFTMLAIRRLLKLALGQLLPPQRISSWRGHS